MSLTELNSSFPEKEILIALVVCLQLMEEDAAMKFSPLDAARKHVLGAG